MLGLERSPWARSAASHTAQPGLLLRKFPGRMRRELGWWGEGSGTLLSLCPGVRAAQGPLWHSRPGIQHLLALSIAGFSAVGC